MRRFVIHGGLNVGLTLAVSALAACESTTSAPALPTPEVSVDKTPKRRKRYYDPGAQPNAANHAKHARPVTDRETRVAVETRQQRRAREREEAHHRGRAS